MKKKIVLTFYYTSEKTKQKGMQKVSGISGVESIGVDTSSKKMTIVGNMDPVEVVEKLRKLGHVDIISVGPAKDEIQFDAQQHHLLPRSYSYYYQPMY